MKNVLILLICTIACFLSGCDNGFKVSESITIGDTNNCDNKEVSAVVFEINQQQIKEKIYTKFPYAEKDYVEGLKIRVVEKTKSLKFENDKVKTNYNKKVVYVEMTMNYNKLKPEEAMLIMQYYKVLLNDELIKLGV